jgi:hypothetical protein
MAATYPAGAMTERNARELREQRAEQAELRERALAVARRRGERNRAQQVERERMLAPFLAEKQRLEDLVARAQKQHEYHLKRALADPLSIDRALQLIGAECCVTALQDRLVAHEEERP